MTKQCVLPVTVIWKWQEALVPLPSTVSHATVVCPMGKLFPDDGLQITSETLPELSVALGFSHITIAVGKLSSVCFVKSSTQVICGASRSVI